MNPYAYALNNPYRYVDRDGRLVVFNGSHETQEALKKAYEEVKTTKHGEELCSVLEDSSKTYKIEGANNDAYYNPNNNTIAVDPNFHPNVMTSDGPQPAPTEIILGHEIGHAATGAKDDGPDHMDNIRKNENPIRKELGLPARIEY